MSIVASDPTHLAFSDESQYNFGRFRGIALVTLPASDYKQFHSELMALLNGSGLTEFKWSKLRTARERLAALKLLDWALGRAWSKTFRVDVLTWDIEDERHRIKGRDDTANLQRMYYHLFKNVLRQRWPDGSRWQLFPDEQTALDWREVDNFLNRASIVGSIQQNFGERGGFRVRLKTEFSIHQITPCHSDEQPLVQMADLFAGLGVYSRASYDCYHDWVRETGLQQHIFPRPAVAARSASDEERCVVLSEFDRRCKQENLGVSLRRQRGLKTFSPTSPFNFWWYEPQHILDKAPTKAQCKKC